MQMRDFYKALIFIMMIAALFVIVIFRDAIFKGFTLPEFISQNLYPCSKTLTYTVGTIDPRFKISTTTLLADIDQAVSYWNKATSKKFFAYDPDGEIKVNMVYDDRQQATDALKKLDIVIDDTKSSYENLKAKYEALRAVYNKDKSDLQTMSSQYDAALQAYENSVRSYNNQGLDPLGHANLFDTRDKLNRQREVLIAKQNVVNQEASTLNSMATVLNQMIPKINSTINNYNQIVGTSSSSQFEEGQYASGVGFKKIDVYEYGTQAELVRLLEHEFGHALNLDHVANSDSIMYYLNISKNMDLTAEDLAQLKLICQIP